MKGLQVLLLPLPVPVLRMGVEVDGTSLHNDRHALNAPGVAQLKQGLVRDPVKELPLKLGFDLG